MGYEYSKRIIEGEATSEYLYVNRSFLPVALMVYPESSASGSVKE